MRRHSLVLFASVTVAACGVADGGGDATNGGDTSGSAHPRFSPLYSSYLHKCGGCHAPDAPGRVTPIEETLDFTNEETAYQTLRHGEASGLVGTNAEACNGVLFVVPGSYEQSLLAAVVDPAVRSSFSTGSGCTGDAIGDMALKVGDYPGDAFLAGLADWIATGAE